MTPADFTLSAVPLRGPLAPIADLLSDGDGVFVDAGDGGWWGRIGARPEHEATTGWVWVEVPWVWCHTPVVWLAAADLTTSPAARSAVVAWLASQGHADAGANDGALLSALRAVCGLPAVWPAERYSDDDIPF